MNTQASPFLLVREEEEFDIELPGEKEDST